MEIYVGQEEPFVNAARLNGYKYYCDVCGKGVTKRYKSDSIIIYIEEIPEITGTGYKVERYICRECAERRGYILIDDNHPIIKYKRLLKELKVVSERIYRKEGKKIIKRINGDTLDKLNNEVFQKITNTTISETREKLKLIKEYASLETVLKFEEYIEECVQNIEEFAELKKKIILCERELEQLLLNCKERIKCASVVKDELFVDDEEDEEIYEITEYSKSEFLQNIRDEDKYKYKGPYCLEYELRIVMLSANCWKWQEKENGN